jgi:hypothetical protein
VNEGGRRSSACRVAQPTVLWINQQAAQARFEPSRSRGF